MRINFPYEIRIFLLFLFIYCPQSAYPFDEISGTDVRALSLGQVKSLGYELLNPAFLSFHEQKLLGASVYSRFGMKELNTKSLYGIFPNTLIDAGFKWSVYGYEDYQLFRGQIAFAKKIFPGFSIGTNLVYLNENSILEDKSQNYLLADVGVYWRINDSFDWAFTAENLLFTMNSSRTLFCTGVNYRLLPACRILIETGCDFRNYFRVSAGVEYEIAGQFTVRGGFLSNPQMPAIGFGYVCKQWKIDAGFMLHPMLGLSSAIGAGCFF
jgi:hypothetical protein